MTCATGIYQTAHYRAFREHLCTVFQDGASVAELAHRYRLSQHIIEVVIRDGLKNGVAR